MTQWPPTRKPTFIQPVTARESDEALLRKSLWQIADQNGVFIMQLGWHHTPTQAHAALQSARAAA